MAEQDAKEWEATFLHLKAKLRPMIKDQIENVKVHKENMDLKRTITSMEHRVAQERESNRVQYKTLEGRVKDLAHVLEKQLQRAGQSRGTAILSTSFTMGDTDRISKVLKERSNYSSS